MLKLSKRCKSLVVSLLLCGCLVGFSSVSFAADVFSGHRISSSDSANGVFSRIVVSSSDPWVEFETISSISSDTAYTMYRGYIKDYYTVTLENTNDFPTYLASGEEMYLQAYCANPGYGSYFGTDNGFTISIDDTQGCHISSVGVGSGGSPGSQVYFYLDDSHYYDGNLVLLPHETVTVSFTATREYSVHASDNDENLHLEKQLIHDGLQGAYINSVSLFNEPTANYIISNFPVSPNGGSSTAMSPSDLNYRTVNIVSSTDGSTLGNVQTSYSPLVPTVRDSYLVPNYNSSGQIVSYYYESLIDYSTIFDLSIYNWSLDNILITRPASWTGSGMLQFDRFSFTSSSSDFSVQSFTISDVSSNDRYFTAAIQSSGIAISPPAEYLYNSRIYLPKLTSILGNVKVTFSVKVRYNQPIYDSSVAPDSSVLSSMLDLDFDGFYSVNSFFEATNANYLTVTDSDRLDSLGDDITSQTEQQQHQHEEQMEQSQQQYEDLTDPGITEGEEFITGTDNAIKDKIGIFTFIDTLLENLLGLFVPPEGDPTLTFPGFSIEIAGETHQIWTDHTFNLASLDEDFSVLLTAVRFGTVAVVYFALINFLGDTYLRIFAGGKEDD